MGKKKPTEPSRIAAQNRRARHNYEILEEVEAGICLTGTEVKSLRAGKGNLTDSHAEPATYEGDYTIYLVNAYIPEYAKAGQHLNHNPRRPRKLLLHQREIKRLSGKVEQKGLTLIALDIHWNDRGIAKVKLALCKGKASHDKRAAIKEREWNISKQRALRDG